MKKLQQFFIYKISTDRLKRYNYNINLTISDARKSGELVSIGDSQMLRTLRRIKGQSVDYDEICRLFDQKRTWVLFIW